MFATAISLDLRDMLKFRKNLRYEFLDSLKRISVTAVESHQERGERLTVAWQI